MRNILGERPLQVYHYLKRMGYRPHVARCSVLFRFSKSKYEFTERMKHYA